MNDIVKRLRLQPEDIGGPSRMDMCRERGEAADEIERLRNALNDCIVFAEKMADALDVEMDDCIIRVQSKEVGVLGERSWADVQLAARAALGEANA